VAESTGSGLAVNAHIDTVAPYSRAMTPRVSFAKLHNEAYQSDPAAPAVVDALAAAEEAGMDIRRCILGWEVSSDARIFGHLRPGGEHGDAGPGKLALAHSDQEQITVEELCRATLMLALYILRNGGFTAGKGASGSDCETDTSSRGESPTA